VSSLKERLRKPRSIRRLTDREERSLAELYEGARTSEEGALVTEDRSVFAKLQALIRIGHVKCSYKWHRVGARNKYHIWLSDVGVSVARGHQLRRRAVS